MLLKRMLIILISGTVIACNSQEKPDEVEADPAPSPVVQDNALPDTREDTLMIEGMAEQATLTLYRSPQNWPVRFHTYLPPQMEAETISSGEGDAVKFNFNKANVTLTTLPEGASRSIAQERAMAALGTKAVQPCDNLWEWQWGCYYTTDNPSQVNKIIMGEQQGRYFYFLIRYPADYADGFSPRYSMLLDEWRWEGEE